VHGNGETDTHVDQSSINTKMSVVEWLVHSNRHFHHCTLY